MHTKANKIQEQLQYFNGSEMFYHIPLLRTRFTDGIKYLVNAAACFWLVTDTSVVAKSLKERSSWVTIDFKRLPEKEREASGYEAVIIYSDGNDNILEEHGYTMTDFPLDELRLFFVNDTLMLPSEY
ncbi:hypothetical protein J1D01_02980 [Seonamhaeicola sp. NFXS20]|uniref:DUF6876 family protein n=1 Tax=Seonamhaeicola sp. NFXS20 TaxID=2816959 RepID=UPI003B8ACA7C